MTSDRTFGRFRLLRPLTAGGMAEIFLARQEGPEGFAKTVVLKRILPHLSESQEFVQMFLDEARLAALLSHPNIVQVFDFGEAEGAYYLAMEYLAGEDLGSIQRLAKRKGQQIPPQVCARIIAGACEGLYHAHTLSDGAGKPLNIVHRDVSPSNIMVTYQGVVKVLDFGIAKAEGKLMQTRTGVLKGKYRYMSPEQISGLELDQRSDIFALGVILHELLTGEPLFGGDNELAVIKSVMEHPVPPPRAKNPAIPEQIDEIVMRALERDRDRRFRSARQMRHSFEDFLSARTYARSTDSLEDYLRHLAGEDRIEVQMRLARGEVPIVDGLGGKEHPSSPSKGGSPVPNVGTTMTPPPGLPPRDENSPANEAHRPGKTSETEIDDLDFVPVSVNDEFLLPTPEKPEDSIEDDEVVAARALAGRRYALVAAVLVGFVAVGTGTYMLGSRGGAPQSALEEPIAVTGKQEEPMDGETEVASSPVETETEAAEPEQEASKEPAQLEEKKPARPQETKKVARTPRQPRQPPPEAPSPRPTPAPTKDTKEPEPAEAKADIEAAPPPAPRRPAATGTLVVNCMPWCRVYLNGEYTGRHSPVRDLEVPTGRHLVRVVNPPSGASQEQTVLITANQEARLVFRLD